LGPCSLNDDIREVILEIFRDPRHHGRAYGKSKEENDIPRKFAEGRTFFPIMGRRTEFIDQLSGNDGVAQRETLIDGSKQECEKQKAFMMF
jgi:hypothetical protein